MRMPEHVPPTKGTSQYWLTFPNRSGCLLGAQFSAAVSSICRGRSNWPLSPGLELRGLQGPGGSICSEAADS